jgi:hypothetical protein
MAHVILGLRVLDFFAGTLVDFIFGSGVIASYKLSSMVRT